MSIRIEIQATNPADLAAHLAAIGYTPAHAAPPAPPVAKHDAPQPLPEKVWTTVAVAAKEVEAQEEAEEVVAFDPLPGDHITSDAGPVVLPPRTAEPADDRPRHPSGRIVGEPGPGRKRRSKEEMAEDAAYEESAWAAAAPEPQPEPVEETLEAVEVALDPADADQDRADEEAESAAKNASGLTHEDIRRLYHAYVQKYGMAQATSELPKITGGAISDVPEDRIAGVCAAIEAALEDRPQAMLEDVKEAVMAYALKYDGTSDQKAMKNTVQDIPALLSRLFGPDVKAPKAIPASPENYGKALSAINDAIRDNPFLRTAP